MKADMMSDEAIKPGYKRTEVGVIPNDWTTNLLGELCKFENGDRGKNYPSRQTSVQDGVPFINAGHVSEGRIDLSEMDYISRENFERLGGGKVMPGDILFCLRGSLGKYGVVEEDFGAGAIASSLVIVRPKYARVVREYLTHYFGSVYCTQMIEKWAGGAAQPNLGARDLSRFIIALPPTTAEQRAIAEALSDVDALLEALERLIAKKRAIKQGAMQALLTGRVRLPGFARKRGYKRTDVGIIPSDWDVKRIRDLTSSTAGGTPSTKVSTYWDGTIKWMSSGELHLERVYDVEGRITETGLKNSSAKLIPPKCVLVGLAGQGKTRGTVAMNMVQLCTNQSIAAILPSHCFVPEYLYFNLASRYEELRNLSTGTGGRGGLNLTILNSLMIPFPLKREQAAIAEVLSDMDAEIDALENRRAKLRDLKQGMMQALLTGRIRLVQPQEQAQEVRV